MRKASGQNFLMHLESPLHYKEHGAEIIINYNKGMRIMCQNHIYINSVSLSVCDGGFGGWGRERPVKQRATGVSL